MVVGDHDRLAAEISAFSRNTDDWRHLCGRPRFVCRSEMLLNDSVHFTLCVRREALKADADSNCRAGTLVSKLRRGSEIWSRPNNPGGQRSIRSTGFMGPGVFLGLCGGEAQCRNTTQEFGASIEVKAGAVSAEVGRERFEPVMFPGRICGIKPDWEL